MFSTLAAAAQRFFTGLFFYPDRENLGTPAEKGIRFEDVHFTSGGDRLHGFLMRPPSPSLGTVLHCHGNAGNVTVHFPLVSFLVQAGYEVLTFDYAGYGRSTGRPSLDGIERNARDALNYLLDRKDVRLDRVAVFGQSLGGAAAAAAAIHPAVRCLILEATFTTYREIARIKPIGRGLFFLVPHVIPDGGPARRLPEFLPRPVLLLHGEADSVVPPGFSRRLHRLFPDHTSMQILPTVDHLTVGPDESSPFRETILKFLDRQFSRS